MSGIAEVATDFFCCCFFPILQVSSLDAVDIVFTSLQRLREKIPLSACQGAVMLLELI